jgi:putative drug exporter of the RND superfamily
MARTIRRFSVLIILAWLALTLIVSVAVPQLDQVAKEHSVPMSPQDAPSLRAMKRMGSDFKESNSDSVAMIVVEGQRPLGDDAHIYYNNLVRQLRADTKHVQHVQDFWGNPLTAPGVQSADGRAVYVQLTLAGNQGQPLSTESVEAVRNIVRRTPAPNGIKTYVTGPAAFVSDMSYSGNKALFKVTVTSVAVIFIMLLLVYRSIITVILLLAMVGIELLAAKGIVAFLAVHDLVQLSTFAVNLLVSLAIAAGTDYGIFFVGRYQEARQNGEDRETAYYTAYRGIAPIVLASGLTIAGAVFCLSFARLPYFQSMGVPCAVGMLVAIAVALTLVPAVLSVVSRVGVFDPRRKIKVRGWRRIGTAVVRWPAPILAGTCAVALVGLLALPGYRTTYLARLYIPEQIPANLGNSAANRHFSQARMMPEILLIEADHDMRNAADLLVLERLAKGVLRVPGISGIQSVTRPQGRPMEHTSIPSLLSIQNAAQLQLATLLGDRMNDLVQQADELKATTATMQRMYVLTQQLAGNTHHLMGDLNDIVAITDQVRDHLADFDDFWRPVRNYFRWEKHCYDIPICWAMRSILDSLDGIDEIDEKLQAITRDVNHVDALLPQLHAQFPQMIANMESMRIMLLTMHSSMSGVFGEMGELNGDPGAMGQDFDAARNDDSFYLPRAVLRNPDFKKVMDIFLSPDGKAARFIISDRGDPATPEAISRVDLVNAAAEESLKVTPLEDAKIYVAGVSATYKDVRDASKYDLFIVGIASLCLIFIIMLIITRSFVAAIVIVGTVALSLGASFGLSVLVWQHIVGLELYWLVLAMSVIVLLAVGSDYNLLLVARFKEEMGAGINTGIIRAMGGTGKVVTSAGLVFAFTMGSMAVSDLRIVGQIGTTIGLGLLFDTLIVRSFMMPSVAALLGRWFWWPLNVRARPAIALGQPYGRRPLARSDAPEGSVTT